MRKYKESAPYDALTIFIKTSLNFSIIIMVLRLYYMGEGNGGKGVTYHANESNLVLMTGLKGPD